MEQFKWQEKGHYHEIELEINNTYKIHSNKEEEERYFLVFWKIFGYFGGKTNDRVHKDQKIILCLDI